MVGITATARVLSRMRFFIKRTLGENRTLAEWLMVAALCASFAGLASSQGWLWRIDGVLYDAALSFRPLSPDDDVIIVAIDDRSLAEIGHWPWNRAVHAALLERLTQAGAKVVALDIILHEPAHDHVLGDAALVKAIAEHGRVVLPVTHTSYAARGDGEGLPVPYFAEVAAALGHVHIELDPDGIARSIYLWEGMHTPHYPQLALAALTLASPQQARAYPRPPQTILPGWRRADWMHIPFAGMPGSFRYVSYVDVLRGDVPDEILRDAIVFVGSAAVGMGDMVPTPTSGHSQLMPGVEVHATIFSALRKGEAIRFVSPLVAAVASVALVMLLMLIMLRAGPRTALLAAFGVIMAAFVFSYVTLAFADWWLPPAGAILSAMFAYPLWSWRRLEAAQHYLDNALDDLRRSNSNFVFALPDKATNMALDRFSERIAVVKAAEHQQRLLERFVADTVEGLPVGVVVIDSTGQTQLYNRRAVELLDLDSPTAILTAVTAMGWPQPIVNGDSVINADEPLQAEAELPNGRVVLAFAAPLRGSPGHPQRIVVSLSDISDLRKAQRSREETMHFLSHDLRAPLASILTLAESPVDEHDMTAVRGHIERYARSALSLAENLARLVRAEGIDPTCFTELQLDMLVQDAVDEVWALARAKEIALSIVLDLDEDQEATVRGDADLLRRAIVNLLTNAIKYTPSGGAVGVRLVRNENCWEVRVSDTGIGISEEQCSLLFKRFARLQTAENHSLSGIGLGLLMVRAVSERHGGSVSVSSKPGKGSVFILSLPVLR